ncbi:hypothetical protein [Kaistia sp. UC242_56]|uniref:hypothetical protein n=1 Tax=Kaistia sp. UC242_56 TaxID=3374625 RepID=UPI003792F897
MAERKGLRKSKPFNKLGRLTGTSVPIDPKGFFTELANSGNASGKRNAVPAGPRNGANFDINADGHFYHSDRSSSNPAPPLVWGILAGEPRAFIRVGRRVLASLYRLPDGWIAYLDGRPIVGPFAGLRRATVETMAIIDSTYGSATRRGALLACRPGDFDALIDRRSR